MFRFKSDGSSSPWAELAGLGIRLVAESKLKGIKGAHLAKVVLAVAAPIAVAAKVTEEQFEALAKDAFGSAKGNE